MKFFIFALALSSASILVAKDTDITQFGAVPGQTMLQTEAIQKAIDACAETGGGTIRIPSGTYLSGTIRLYSNQSLSLEKDAVLKGADTFKDYPPIPFKWDLYPATHSLIYAIGATNVTITGSGVLDLNDQPFVRWDKLCTALPKSKESLLTDKQRSQCHYLLPREGRPNRLVFLHKCRNVNISGITVRNAPAWALVTSCCQSVEMKNLTITNHPQVPNNDGIHCCSCREVNISECRISSGDDCIAITGISDYNKITEHVIISDCELRSSSAAVRIGFEASKIKDVQLKRLNIKESNRGVAIFAGKGGIVENVLLSDITMQTRIAAGPWWGNGEPIVICASGYPEARISNISARNISAQTENGILIFGNSGNVRNVTLKGLQLSIAYGENRPLYGKDNDLSPHPKHPAPDPARHIPWLQVNGAENITADNIVVNRQTGERVAFDTTAVGYSSVR